MSGGDSAQDVVARFDAAARRFAAHVAIEIQRRERVDRYGYEELRRLSESGAAFLAAHGVEPGERCAILAENDVRWCAMCLAILRRGAVAVPLDVGYSPEQIAKLVADCGARVLCASARHLDTALAAVRLGVPRVVLIDGPVPETPAGVLVWSADARSAPPAPGLEASAAALILYTSGTTSDPKGVVLTHGNLIAEGRAALETIDLGPHDVVLGVLPLFHALAFIANLMLPLTIGARVVFLETVSSGEVLRALAEREITAFCCVPQFFYLLHQRILERAARGRARRVVFRALLAVAGFARRRLGIPAGRWLFRPAHRALGPRMRLLVTGGSSFDPRVGRHLFDMGFNILQAYGLTETTGGATVLRPGDSHVGSVGQALPGVELRIVPDESGALPPGSAAAREAPGVGEVAIRGPVVTPGYYGRPEATAQALRDGWLHTGDLGYLDAAGRLYITGRAKELIVLGSGKNVYPAEVEAHYEQSPWIRELCVIGIAPPGEPHSERLHAVVVPDFDRLRERKVVNAREVLRFDIEGLSARLPAHKRVLSYDIVTEPLPRTPTRKLKRFEVQRRVAEAWAAGTRAAATSGAAVAADSAWEADPHVARALALLRSAVREPATLRAASNLELDLGLDSMERIELLARLEARFGHRLPEEVAHSIYTVRELVEAFRPAGGADGRAGDDADAWPRLLGQAPADDPVFTELVRPRPAFTRLAFLVMQSVRAFAGLGLGLRVAGREHLPPRGSYVVCPNHPSFLDPFVVSSVLPWHSFSRSFFVGASDYFGGRLRARLARLIRVVPIDPDTNLVRAMQAGFHGLSHDRVLILFPEGERSIDGGVKRFKRGAALLARHAGVPIVPVALDGMHEVWPRGRAPRLRALLPGSGTRLRVRFGPPLAPPDRAGGEPADAALTARLQAEVEALRRELRSA